MKCDMMATAAAILLVLAYHPICAIGIAIVGGSIPRTICPRSSDIAGDSPSFLCQEDHPAASETPVTTTEEDSMKLVGMLASGHQVSISMPKTATEEDVRSLSRVPSAKRTRRDIYVHVRLSTGSR